MRRGLWGLEWLRVTPDRAGLNQTGAVRQTITVKPRVRGQPQSKEKELGKNPHTCGGVEEEEAGH